MSSVLEHQ